MSTSPHIQDDVEHDVARMVAAGLMPGAVAAARRRLGPCDPHQVVAALRRRVGSSLPLADVERRSSCPDDALLVTGRSMPDRLSATWDQGGPLWVHWRGVLPADGPHVGVVGTRRATADGLGLAGDMAAGLVGAGVTVVSGVARGIDQAAHRGALDAGGRTVGVLGAGLDIDYPAGTAELRRRIAGSGGLVSEYPAGHGIRNPGQFPARNRILVGLCDALVVVEAGRRSGALNSVTWALAFNRDVMVVPASPTNAAAAGSLALLVEGAAPVRDADDVLGLLGLTTSDPPAPGQTAGGAAPGGVVGRLSAPAGRLLELLGPTSVTPSTLADLAGLSPRQVLVSLSELEDAGLARRTGQGVCRTRPGGRI
jgi:DNA processing protein